MGYYFNDLGFIVFSDPKFSYKDIIQCIGRRLKSDNLREDCKNKLKELLLLIPTHENELNNKYSKIIEILKYLILEIEIEIENQLINSICKKSNSNNSENSEEYNGKDDAETIILNLLYNEILDKINTKKLINICINNKIYTESQYNDVKKSLELKDIIYDYNKFK